MHSFTKQDIKLLSYTFWNFLCRLNALPLMDDNLCLLTLCSWASVWISPQITLRSIRSAGSEDISVVQVSFSCPPSHWLHTAGSSVRTEGQVNKSTASYAKLITQRSNCAAAAHSHTDRYRWWNTYRQITQTYLNTAVINLLVTFETDRFVTVGVFNCLPANKITESLSSQPATWRMPDLRLRIFFHRLPHTKTNIRGLCKVVRSPENGA